MKSTPSNEETPPPGAPAWIAEASGTAMLMSGADQRITYANAGFQRLFGHAPEEVLGRRLTDVLAGPGTDPQFTACADAPLAGPGSYRAETLLYTRAGQPLWILAVVDPVGGADGPLRQKVYVLSDITAVKIHEVLPSRLLEAMRHARGVDEVMALACQEIERLAPDLLVTVVGVQEAGARCLAAPSLPAAYATLIEGLAGGEGAPLWLKAREDGEDGKDAEEGVMADIATDSVWAAHRHLALPLGLAACWIRRIQSHADVLLGAFVCYFRTPRPPDAFHRQLIDVCLPSCALALERERTRAHIHQLAFYDGLTGLPNRQMLHAKAERTLDDVTRANTTLAVLVIDLDRFKLVNDAHGHAAGDELLREVAQRLVRGVRGIDLVGRLAGDEFVAILPACSVEHAAIAAERLLSAVAEPLPLLGGPLNPGASIGVAMYPEDGPDLATLLRHADLAMAEAKSDRRGTSRFFNDGMNRVAQERLALESALRLALREGGLQLHYQPQVHCGAEGRLYGVEALARWQDAYFGEVSPERFIPLAEECGLIDALGDWALGEACRQLADWRGRGVAVPRMGVNLSTHNFQDAGLAVRVAATLDRHGLVPADLTLEMTERAMLDPSAGVQASIEAVHALGVHLSLDDFGTGYSSLSYLHRLPMGELKLDKSFVQDLGTSTTAQALINSMLRIGDSLRLTVVAEGVETQAQSDFLHLRGCQVVQGYLFGRPLPAEQFEQWLLDREAA